MCRCSLRYHQIQIPDSFAPDVVVVVVDVFGVVGWESAATGSFPGGVVELDPSANREPKPATATNPLERERSERPLHVCVCVSQLYTVVLISATNH